MSNKWKLAISLITPNAVGWLGSIFTFSAIPGWYANLNKPPFSPPNWVFGPVWTLLYTLMGVACYLIWIQKNSTAKKQAQALFLIQLILNGIWTPVFFGFKQIEIALGIIILLVIAVLLTIISFYRIKPLAAYLLIPYLLWISFATLLNASIVMLN